MKISVDHYERDIIMETLQYRLEHDDHLIQEMTLKDNLEDLLRLHSYLTQLLLLNVINKTQANETLQLLESSRIVILAKLALPTN